MSMLLVVDASFTIELILPNPEQDRCRKLMAEWMQNRATLYAPTLRLYEVMSALTKAIHFEILTEPEGHQALQLAQGLDLQLIHPDKTLAELAYDWTRRLDRAAAYDSFYLALTESLSAKLWTADKRLANAVSGSWVQYIADSV